jgi:glycosyltransferase involved in cell wall biosynthesis
MNYKESEIKPDTNLRPEFSRFERNLENGASLPIFPLSLPTDGHAGVVLVGDYVAEDMIQYLGDMRKWWIAISTTQSDGIPTDCEHVDFNFFSNASGIDRYLASPAGKVPFSIEIGDGHYVDPQLFFPDKDVPKIWDIVYIAKWYPTKMTEILVEAARMDPGIRVAIFGWPVLSERKIQQSLKYRDYIGAEARELPNIDVYGLGNDTDISHVNPDGSFVVGSLTKPQIRDRFMRPARSTVLLAAETEGINRSITEMLCCDVPIMVAPTNSGIERLVQPQTGIFIERTPKGIIEGVHYIRNHEAQFSPRDRFLKNFGKKNANRELRRVIREAAERRGVSVQWEKLKDYGGDVWTTPDIYKQVLHRT